MVFKVSRWKEISKYLNRKLIPITNRLHDVNEYPDYCCGYNVSNQVSYQRPVLRIRLVLSYPMLLKGDIQRLISVTVIDNTQHLIIPKMSKIGMTSSNCVDIDTVGEVEEVCVGVCVGVWVGVGGCGCVGVGGGVCVWVCVCVCVCVGVGVWVGEGGRGGGIIWVDLRLFIIFYHACLRKVIQWILFTFQLQGVSISKVML